MAVIVRQAVPEDVEAIFDIRTAVRENHLSREQLAALGITPQSIGNTIATGGCLWIAEVDGSPAGFSMIDADDACLFALFVKPAFEGFGCGRLLLDAAETELFGRHPVIWLTTAAHSRAAGFYRHLGWIAAGAEANGDLRLEKSRPIP